MKQEQAAPEVTLTINPIEDICQALFETEESAKKSAARKTVGAMTQRPWQQLPSRLRSAIRSDVGHLADHKTREQIVALGYSVEILGQALRDLGRKIA
ncbi:hypothetical protein PWG15_12585 [Ensifer adhaerens]|uniref:hypothetical protein n=1 Tax=Ensifer adhaerens TaxID=106592 RepID=UPI0023A9F71F|nr:hypothetical protein [Ensifer adhaerens]WDZ75453.1 hypothetical protein PWG15_12585 [Ensifer adhaerens]